MGNVTYELLYECKSNELELEVRVERYMGDRRCIQCGDFHPQYKVVHEATFKIRVLRNFDAYTLALIVEGKGIGVIADDNWAKDSDFKEMIAGLARALLPFKYQDRSHDEHIVYWCLYDPKSFIVYAEGCYFV